MGASLRQFQLLISTPELLTQSVIVVQICLQFGCGKRGRKDLGLGRKPDSCFVHHSHSRHRRLVGKATSVNSIWTQSEWSLCSGVFQELSKAGYARCGPPGPQQIVQIGLQIQRSFSRSSGCSGISVESAKLGKPDIFPSLKLIPNLL